MNTTVFLDSFSGAIDDMTRKDQRNAIKVLHVLAKHPRFSTFDATANNGIATTLTYLFREEFIVDSRPKQEYPWHQVEVTEKGKSLLGSAQKAASS
jgi:hypothetical protein